MIALIDNFLNSITMYRLVLYYLVLLIIVAFLYSIFGFLPFGPFAILFSSVFLTVICYVSNKFFERLFNIQTNVESLYITALILALIITPTLNLQGIVFLAVAGILAMASKYILNISGKHVFNPAAIAVIITSFTIIGFASWWVGTLVMLPWTLLGILIVRKIRKYDLVFYFVVANIIITILSKHSFITLFVDSPILFFAFVMLTEPLTTPPTKGLQSVYGALTGILFAPLHIGPIVTTPEMALSIGNIFSYIVSPKEKLVLKLREKIKLTSQIYDFVFDIPHKLNFTAGQYFEWTLGHPHTDSRGNRRYFTIASSPTEDNLRIGVKFPEGNESSFKKTMLSFRKESEIVIASLAGDFTLPKDVNKKLVFIAGGIGVTPYRSIIKYLIDTNEKRDIVLLYSEKNKNEMVYKDIFDEAKKKLHLKVIYFETEKRGHVNSEIMSKEIADFKNRIFYISGSHGMVTAFHDVLKELKISENQIKVDYFPGF